MLNIKSVSVISGLVRCLFMAVLCWQPVPIVCADEATADVVTTDKVAINDFTIDGLRFQIPAGYTLTQVAGPPLVDRPIAVAFDEQGALYVSESSGSNDPVEEQLKQRPHRILRLVDVDGDGVFDRKTIFADHMMFPAGTMWLDGSLYVTAPPSIWKLTDTDGDGVCDQREEWFDAKTLTNCANDLHGPYRGPDGWVYWCKGASAEQTYPRPGSDPFVTRAAHIFRRHPGGGIVEPVMTGGMDNPVDVVFSRGGERFFTTTFLKNPGGGQRDGLIHAIYGGVYGKRHHRSEGHPRTGDLMPPMTHLGAAAPSGFTRLKSDQLGFRDHFVAALFNMQKVTRHQLVPHGATFQTQDSDLVVCDHLDFHPTDVVEDADGSLLIVDTGGWYKLCCPTSQLHKPDVLGAIYRLKKTGSHAVADSRGGTIDWSSLTSSQLVAFLSDERPAVQQRAADALARIADSSHAASSPGNSAVTALAALVTDSPSTTARTLAVWTLGRIGTAEAFTIIRTVLDNSNEDVRLAAIHTISLHRDKQSVTTLHKLLQTDSAAVRRATAEALGRMGDANSIAPLLTAAADVDDRILEHSITYAMIEIGDESAVREGLTASSTGTQRAALMALDQMTPSRLKTSEVLPHLAASDDGLRATALWIADRHSEWAPEYAEFLVDELRGDSSPDRLTAYQTLLVHLVEDESTRSTLAPLLAEPTTPRATRLLLLDAIAESKIEATPASWNPALVGLLESDDKDLVSRALTTFTSKPPTKLTAATLARLSAMTDDESNTAGLRLSALVLSIKSARALDELRFDFVMSSLDADNPEPTRSLAADVLRRAAFTQEQKARLVVAVPDIGPLEIDRIVTKLALLDDKTATNTIRQLKTATSVGSLSEERLRKVFADQESVVKAQLDELLAELKRREQQQRQELIQIADSLPEGDVRRGQAVFHSEKTNCKACHQFGYLGGQIGPELTRIGKIRSKYDLLESILVPSASFVRSYEPVLVLTVDGRVINGLLRDETAEEVVLMTTERKPIRIARADIEEMEKSKVSIMPAGLEKQISQQQLADLLAFLENAK